MRDKMIEKFPLKGGISGLNFGYNAKMEVYTNNSLLHSPINKLSRTYPHAFSQLYEVES